MAHVVILAHLAYTRFALAQPGQTLVTAELARAAGDGFDLVSCGERPLRGKKLPVEILELR